MLGGAGRAVLFATFAGVDTGEVPARDCELPVTGSAAASVRTSTMAEVPRKCIASSVEAKHGMEEIDARIPPYAHDSGVFAPNESELVF